MHDYFYIENILNADQIITVLNKFLIFIGVSVVCNKFRTENPTKLYNMDLNHGDNLLSNISVTIY